MYNDLERGGDPRWRLRGQLQIQPVEQQSLVGLGLGVTTQDEGAAVGGRQVHIDHLDGGEFLQGGPWGQPRREGAQTRFQGDLEAIGQARNETMRFDSRLQLVINRANTEVTLQLFKSLFHFGALDIPGPELDRVVAGQVEGVAMGDGKILPEQFTHRTVIEPVTVQTPFAAGVDQAVRHQRLEDT